MISKNQFIDQVCGLLKRFKSAEFEVRLREEWRAPEENSREVIQIMSADFDAIRDRTDEINLFIGRFFGAMLLIEMKLVSLLETVDREVESKIFGRKIDLYKDFLSELFRIEAIDNEELTDYRSLVGPLKELALIRNEMAHNLRYVRFNISDIPQTVSIIRTHRPEWHSIVNSSEESVRALLAVHFFGVIFSEKTAFIRQMLR